MDPNTSEYSPRKHARNVLVVLLSAFVCGLLLVAFMLNRWGPTGNYPLRNVLLEPALLSKLSYSEVGGSPKAADRLVFDKIEFTTFDTAQGRWLSVDVPQSTYAHFYDIVKDDWSASDPDKTLTAPYSQGKPARLILWVKPASGSAAQRSSFQELDFSPDGNAYRVELHGHAQEQWVYFIHPNIYRQAQALFVPSP